MEITEQQVVEWMRANMNRLRNYGNPIHVTSLSVYDEHINWSVHACGECEMSGESSDHAALGLRKKLGSPTVLAARKRQEAAALIAEAERLEVAA